MNHRQVRRWMRMLLDPVEQEPKEAGGDDKKEAGDPASSTGEEKQIKRGPGRKPYMTRQDELFLYLIEYKEENDGLAPSLEEIQKVMGFKSKNTVWRRLKFLEMEGKIVLKGGRESRGIMINGGIWLPPDW